jgi:hypothetical protein
MVQRQFTFGILLVSLFSGCIASEGTTGTPAGSNTPQVVGGPATFNETAGAVEGLVLNAESLPVEAAVVALVLDASPVAQVLTDATGRFVFNGVAPGAYTLATQKLGFKSAAKRVEVQAGEVTSASMVIEEIEVYSPYHKTFQVTGYFECSYQAGSKGPCFYPVVGTNTSVVPVDPWVNNKRQFNYGAPPGAMTVLNEMQWTQTTAATGDAMSVFFSYQERTGSHWYCDAASASPIYMRWDRARQDDGSWDDDEDEPGTCLDGDVQLPDDEPQTIPMDGSQIFTSRANTGPSNLPGLQQAGVGGAFQQSFDMVITSFHWEFAPDGWTGLEDG